MQNEKEGFVNVVIGLVKGVAEFISSAFKNLHKEGQIFVVIAFAFTIIAFIFSEILWVGFLFISAWVVYFFRDPPRIIPENSGIFVAPADGTITQITKNELLPEELEEAGDKKFTKISIFLNVFNVHVNRVPAKGKIIKAKYIAGKFLNASLDKSSKENERNILLLTNEENETFAVTQIAGLIARRIVSYAKEEELYERGQRYGIIRFGSRVDVYIPQNYTVNVLVGQTMVGGETIIAQKNSNE